MDILQELSKLSSGIMEDLLCYPHHQWCRAFIGTSSKYDSVENNIAETFNRWILQDRSKIIYIMLDEIRVKVMKRIKDMKAFVQTWQTDLL